MSSTYGKIYNAITHHENAEENLELLKDHALEGNAEAQFFLSKYYFFVENNKITANYWLALAADQEDEKALKTACKLLKNNPKYIEKLVTWRRNLKKARAEKKVIKRAKLKAQKNLTDFESMLTQYLRVDDDVWYTAEYRDYVIYLLKRSVESKQLGLAKKLVEKAACGDFLASDLLADKALRNNLRNAYQDFVWHKECDEVMLAYISKVYPAYNELLKIEKHISEEGIEGDYTQDIEKLTDIRGIAGFELLTKLADLGCTAAMEAAVRINYQSEHIANCKNYLEFMRESENKSARMYVLLAVAACFKDMALAMEYLETGFMKHGEEVSNYLDKFIKSQIPTVRMFVGIAYAKGFSGVVNMDVSRKIHKNLQNMHKKHAEILESVILSESLYAA